MSRDRAMPWKHRQRLALQCSCFPVMYLAFARPSLMLAGRRSKAHCFHLALLNLSI